MSIQPTSGNVVLYSGLFCGSRDLRLATVLGKKGRTYWIRVHVGGDNVRKVHADEIAWVATSEKDIHSDTMAFEAARILFRRQVTNLIGPLTADEWAAFRLRVDDNDDADFLVCCANTSGVRDLIFDLFRMGASNQVTDNVRMFREVWEIMIDHGLPTGQPGELLRRMHDYYLGGTVHRLGGTRLLQRPDSDEYDGLRYSIATVTDNTPTDLAFGTYRGLVVLEPNGEACIQVPDQTHALAYIGGRLHLEPTDLEVNELEGQEWYGQVWDVTPSKEWFEHEHQQQQQMATPDHD